MRCRRWPRSRASRPAHTAGLDARLRRNPAAEERQPQPRGAPAYLEITRKHSLRLRQLIGDLFELSKLDAASVQPELEDFSLAELLQDVAQEFELEAQKKGITLEVQAPSEPAVVHADIRLIQRVLENLLRNALKYTLAGGSVTVSLAPRPGRVSVAVADTGCGIEDHRIGHIFDRFYSSEQDENGRPLRALRRQFRCEAVIGELVQPHAEVAGA